MEQYSNIGLINVVYALVSSEGLRDGNPLKRIPTLEVAVLHIVLMCLLKFSRESTSTPRSRTC